MQKPPDPMYEGKIQKHHISKLGKVPGTCFSQMMHAHSSKIMLWQVANQAHR